MIAKYVENGFDRLVEELVKDKEFNSMKTVAKTLFLLDLADKRNFFFTSKDDTSYLIHQVAIKRSEMYGKECQ